MKRILLIAALLAGCAPLAPPAPGAAPAADNAAAWYRQAAAAGSEVLVIDPARSLIAVTVRRGGPLARLGHDHVVASRGVTGFAAPAAGRADFSFRLDHMSVDDSALRTEAGLDTTPSAAAIEGTRTNMLARVLDAARFPVVALHAESAGTDKFRLTITLHGQTRTVEAPARIERQAGEVIASGALQLRQSEFGITPMSVMAGAMTVEDTMELRYRIVARPQR
jgi:polyisoprenoid-binding protein YceI